MRIWSNRGKDDGSIHPIGNGEMLVYEQGPNMIQLIGPPYSAPSFLRMDLQDVEEIEVQSQREPGTAIWHHDIYKNGVSIGYILDYILPDENVFIREIEAEEELRFQLQPSVSARTHPLKAFFGDQGEEGDVILFTLPKGTNFFTNDPLPWENRLLFTMTGTGKIRGMEGKSIELVVHKGHSRMIFSSHSHYPTAVAQMEEILLKNPPALLEKSRRFWQTFTSRRRDFAALIPQEAPLRQTMLEAIDSVSVLIKCQQSNSGGVAAGHFYPLAYVRDQAGVIRGLLALGYIEEAKAILRFWKAKWELFGNLYNAEGMGNDAARLYFANDEVEIPAYIILSCFRYLDYTGDHLFLKEALPMMEWALDIQLSHLVEGMTEFSGDETYIAGRVLPRHCIYHGSAESTLLFITGGERLLEWVEAHGLWPEGKINMYREKVDMARQRYKVNFIEDGKLYANQPLRDRVASKPRFRFYFCDIHENLEKTNVLTWTERNFQGDYCCPSCRNRKLPDTVNREKRYLLNSVSLVPGYIESDLFTPEELETLVQPTLDLFREKGRVPSDVSGNRSLGYDYGLLLYNLILLNKPEKEAVLKKTLSLLDPTGAWVEYYDGDSPHNCRARPWESAMNIEGVIAYIEKEYSAT